MLGMGPDSARTAACRWEGTRVNGPSRGFGLERSGPMTSHDAPLTPLFGSQAAQAQAPAKWFGQRRAARDTASSGCSRTVFAPRCPVALTPRILPLSRMSGDDVLATLLLLSCPSELARPAPHAHPFRVPSKAALRHLPLAMHVTPSSHIEPAMASGCHACDGGLALTIAMAFFRTTRGHSS
jgi:hypothetical protein